MAMAVLMFAKKANDHVIVNYDGNKDITLVSVDSSQAGGLVLPFANRGISFAYECPGNSVGCKPQRVEAVCHFDTYVNKGWQMMDGPKEVIFLMGQDRIALDDVQWDGNTNLARSVPDAPTMLESLHGTISPEQFHKLASASELKVAVGSFKFEIKDDEIGKWRELDAKISQ